MKLVFWAVKVGIPMHCVHLQNNQSSFIQPTPTGLEEMPDFNTSLGCEDAPYIFNSTQMAYAVPFDISKARHVLELQGGAVGTLVLEDAAIDAEDIEIDLIVRTNDKALLDFVTFNYPTRDEINEGLSDSRARLSTPRMVKTSCMRYDIVLRVPPSLKDLDIQSHAISQIQFASQADINLDSLSVAMYAASNKNMLLPKSNVHAKELTLAVPKGWLVGEVSIVDKTVINTKGGDAVSNVRVLPFAQTSKSESAELGKAVLETTTGVGRSDFFYISDLVSTRRAISSTHTSSSKGDMYLTYSDADFSGKVQMKAQSYSAIGLQHEPGLPPTDQDGTMHAWVGDANGEDMLVVRSERGWVGLYF